MINFETKSMYLIIGAGPVGLAYAKELKAANLPYHQIEADNDVGGNWLHGVYETTHIISPRDIMQYSDYPMPLGSPEFPSQKNMLSYYREYADTFQLRANITFNTKVIYVRPIADSLWEVHLNNGETRVYKAILVCNGHHWNKKMPEFMGHFDGEIIHAKDYKNPDQLRGKKVIVVGAGNSACDLASEAARVGKSAYMSMRSSAWFFPKLIMGRPLSYFAKPWSPDWLQRIGLKIGLKLIIGDLSLYGLPKPDHEIFTKHPTIGVEALHYIKHGRLFPKPNIKELAGKKVIFTDNSEVEADLIVAATGYYLSYPFLPKELQRVKGTVAQTYGGCCLPDYKGLYLIGWEQARGGVGALAPDGGKMMVDFLKLQEKMTVPIGLALKEMGYTIAETHLIGMFKLLKNMKKLRNSLALIQKTGEKLGKNGFANPVLPLPTKLENEMLVY